MSLIPCDLCHQRVPEKLSQVTTAWYRADQQRVAFRGRWCTACFAARVLPLDKDLDYANGLTCPACGISVEQDMDPTYITAFIPGAGKISLECPTCPACAVSVRARAQDGGVKLEDRSVEGPRDSQGPSTMTSRESYWAALGIRPNRGSES